MLFRIVFCSSPEDLKVLEGEGLCQGWRMKTEHHFWVWTMVWTKGRARRCKESEFGEGRD